ncbi:MAG TPA: DnaB-like helicase C-terminal domain-containing protein [Anaerolineales bacterium]|nr:DnaB-like helicase C-terminal domain-containing protein [Anaerolineales bacterium]
MARIASTGIPNPYHFFGTYAGLPFWGGGLTLLAAAPGIGKTSWMLRMLLEAASARVPCAMGCYEHTEDELKYRLSKQSEAKIAGAHGIAMWMNVEEVLASSAEGVLLALNDKTDTIRSLEESLLKLYCFPEKGNALVLVDYLNRVPVVGLSGIQPVEVRSGDAAIELREMAKRHGWAVLAAAALDAEAFNKDSGVYDLSDLFGDERVPYTADRVYLVSRDGVSALACSCVDLMVHTLKDRTGPIKQFKMQFWGERFYPALENEKNLHDRISVAA